MDAGNLRIVADQAMPMVKEWFDHLARQITLKPGRRITRQDLLQADVLLVRSVTAVNESLLRDTAIKFVGSATIGTDHIDLSYLAKAGIVFHHAPGCNAQSVVDWVLAVFSRLHKDFNQHWWRQRIGIVGAGRVGGLLAERLASLGVETWRCDPPKAAVEPGDFVELHPLMREADIVCVHTPLTQQGPYPTLGMIGQPELALMKQNACLINAGRGPVIQSAALMDALSNNKIKAVLDVWPEEPHITKALLDQVYLASPHVAGYSQEGKWAGTAMVAKALHQWLKTPLPNAPLLPSAPALSCPNYQDTAADILARDLILATHDPLSDTVMMRNIQTEQGLSAQQFDQLRSRYRLRRELGSIALKAVPEFAEPWLNKLGFNTNKRVAL